MMTATGATTPTSVIELEYEQEARAFVRQKAGHFKAGLEDLVQIILAYRREDTATMEDLMYRIEIIPLKLSLEILQAYPGFTKFCDERKVCCRRDDVLLMRVMHFIYKNKITLAFDLFHEVPLNSRRAVASILCQNEYFKEFCRTKNIIFINDHLKWKAS